MPLPNYVIRFLREYLKRLSPVQGILGRTRDVRKYRYWGLYESGSPEGQVYTEREM